MCVAPGIFRHLFIGKGGGTQIGFALSAAIHRNDAVVARRIPNLPLEAPDRFTVPMNQQQWRASAVRLVIEVRLVIQASAMETKVVLVVGMPRSACQ
jgi:hypothetical protein